MNRRINRYIPPPIPIATPAHGTAYDIVGQGVANPQAMRNAFDLAVRMGQAFRHDQTLPPNLKETMTCN